MKIVLDSKIYPLEAILNASYSFIDRAYVFLDKEPRSDKIKVSLKGKKNFSSKRQDLLIGEFMNELLHSVLRCVVSKENKKIREYIVKRALYSALPVSSGSRRALDYNKDPLGIAIPWEDKYGKKRKNLNKV